MAQKGSFFKKNFRLHVCQLHGALLLCHVRWARRLFARLSAPHMYVQVDLLRKGKIAGGAGCCMHCFPVQPRPEKVLATPCWQDRMFGINASPEALFDRAFLFL